ncbi:MAG: hypothetical protein AB1630_09815 [bacterium]
MAKKKRDLSFLIFPFLILISILFLGFYIWMGKYYCEGNTSLPLDDPFIFFQYAQNMADGHFLKYNIEDQATTGVTSLLWQILLSIGFILGFSGMNIIHWSLFLSLIILILAGIFAYLIGKRLASPVVGVVTSLLVILNGPYLWACFSGMDTGLLGMTIILSAFGFLTAYNTKNLLLFAICGSLMAISRPEGFILSIIGCSIILLNQITLPKNEKIPIYQMPLVFLPVITGSFWLFLNLVLTGSINFNTMVAKSALTRGDFSFFGNLATNIRYFFFLLKEVFAGFAGDYINVLNANSGYSAVYFAPFALLFFVLAVFPKIIQEIQTKRLGVYFLAFSWFFGGIFIASITRASGEHIHWHRYIIPYYPLFLVMVCIGIYHLSQAFQAKNETFIGISCFFLLFSFLTALYFGVAYGKNCKDIYFQQIQCGKWVLENTPANATIALNDAGAIKYISQRYCIDLVGLCYPKIARYSTHVGGEGNGPLYEFLEKLERKPDYFIIYPSWFGFGGNILGPEIASFGLYEPTMAGAGSEPKKVFKADFKWLNTGDEIKLQSTKEALRGKSLVDKIDIADVEMESAHSYKSYSSEPGLLKRTFATYASYNDEPSIIVGDGGRIITDGEIFKIKTIPNKDLVIITRCTSPFSIGVYIDGKPAAWWKNTKGDAQTSLWHEPMITISGNFITNPETSIKLEVVDKHRMSYFSPYYWFYQ